MNKILNFGLLLFCKYLLITSATYIGDVSQVLQESVQNHNLVKSPYYLISTPKVWMSTEESVCLVLLREFSLPNAVIDVKIQSFNSKETFVQRYQPFQSSSQCIQIPINEIRAERALLRVQVSDVIDESLEIRIKPSYGLTLIETSKPIYRANEKLQFRIITLNDWLRPIEEQFQQISVQNSKSISVMQWNSINATNGLISLEMPIAEDNVWGTWKIRVVTTNNVVTEKIFRVMDYETPNVDITVESPNYIFSTDQQTVSKICVRNSFGHPLKGKLNSFVSYFKFDWQRLNQLSHVTLPYYSNEVEINGCYDLVLQSSKLYWNSTKYSQRNLKLNLQFIDSTNGVIEDKSFDIPVVENQLIISFPSVKLVKQYFKPGLPYFGYVLVSRPDYSFAPDEQVSVCYQSRELPWTTGSDYNCQQIVSNSDGLVHFTIPPLSNQFKQIEVRVQSVKYPNIERKIVLEPTFSPSDEYISIRPLISRSHCYNDFVEFDVLFNKPFDFTNTKFYYQIIGRGLFQAPQEYAFQPLQRWADQSLISVNNNVYNISVTKLRVKIPQQSALNNNIINRILLYYLDANNNLIADSNVFLTTCSDQSIHSTQINLNNVYQQNLNNVYQQNLNNGYQQNLNNVYQQNLNNGYQQNLNVGYQQNLNVGYQQNLNNGYQQNSLNLQLRTHPNSKCAVRVSQNKPYSSLKKINQFIEKFNVYQESSAWDRCEKIYNNRKHESETLYSPYTAPYGLQEVNTNYQPVINYGDAWDSFNDIGLLVSSNTKLDESPCDWDVYPTDILSQLRERRNDQIQYFNRYTNRYARNQLQEVEKSLFNEILHWNVVNTNSVPIHQQINHNLVSTSRRLYSDAVCVNPQFGISYARNSYTNDIQENSFRLSVRAPQVSRLGETIVYKVFVEKSRQQCLPIQLQFESSEVYEVVNKPKFVCICGNSSEPISLLLKPKQIGSFDVKIVATNPINLSGYDVSPDCAESLSIPFAPQTAIRQLTVNPIGIVSKQVNHHIICNNNDNNIEGQTSALKLHNLSHLRHSGSSQVVVTNDLLEPMLRYVQWKVSEDNHNALDSLSAFAASYYLYSYSNNNSNQWEHRNDLIHELSKSYQSLLTYRHSDGSYSLIKSRNSLGDIALSTSVFRVLAQSKPYLSYVESGNRINRLHHTLLWIYGQQSDDGCFYGTVNNKLNVWPFNFNNQYELTGYVLASLLEAGLDYGSNPLVKAYQCLSNNSNSFLSDIQTHPLSAIFYTYIQILSGKTEGSRTWIQALQPLNNLNERDLLNREMLSYLGLSYYLTNDLSSAKLIGQRLLQSSHLWQTPISSYAVTKLWPVLRSQRSSLQVYRENDETPLTLLLNETHPYHSLVGNRIQTNDNGCLLISNNQIKTNLVTKSSNFKVTIDGLDKGFVTCNRRRVTLCVKENVHYSAVHPVVRVQLITGFDVDKKLMKKLIDNQSVIKYKNLDREVLVFLNSFHNNQESYCVTIPLVQKEELYDTSEAYIRVYDYYNEDLNDVIPYRIPLQCQIVQNFNQNVQNFHQNVQNFNQNVQHFNQNVNQY